ncbi:MAG: hypothetical protein ACTSUE_10380 [Promethearchaeota archaeon]
MTFKKTDGGVMEVLQASTFDSLNLREKESKKWRPFLAWGRGITYIGTEFTKNLPMACDVFLNDHSLPKNVVFFRKIG